MDVESLVKSLEPGTVIFGRFGSRPNNQMETGIFIREDSHCIANIPDTPNLYFKAIMLENQDVIPVVVLIKVENIKNPYNMWLNFQLDHIKLYFNEIIAQENITVHFYSHEKLEKSFKVSNSLREPFFQFRKKISEITAWTNEQFASEFQKVLKKYSTSQDLWDSFDNLNYKKKFSYN